LTAITADLLARYGINSRFEVRLFAPGWAIQRGPAISEAGFSDVSVGIKIFLADESGLRPRTGLLVDVLAGVGLIDDAPDLLIAAGLGYRLPF